MLILFIFLLWFYICILKIEKQMFTITFRICFHNGFIKQSCQLYNYYYDYDNKNKNKKSITWCQRKFAGKNIGNV